MTFLELCQKAAREAGTFGAGISTVVAQTGRNLKLVNYVGDAWQRIQNHRNNWNWMQAAWTGVTIAGTARYTSGALAIASWQEWITDNPATGEKPTTIYLTATGVSDECALRQIEFRVWCELYGRGSQTNNHPIEYAISPAGEFCLGPIPDAVYTLNGLLRIANSTLAANADIPAMPTRYHDLIVKVAVEMLAGHDEATVQYNDMRASQTPLAQALENSQLPKITLGGGPLA